MGETFKQHHLMSLMKPWNFYLRNFFMSTRLLSRDSPGEFRVEYFVYLSIFKLNKIESNDNFRTHSTANQIKLCRINLNTRNSELSRLLSPFFFPFSEFFFFFFFFIFIPSVTNRVERKSVRIIRPSRDQLRTTRPIFAMQV